MTNEKLIEVLKKYQELLHEEGVEPVRQEGYDPGNYDQDPSDHPQSLMQAAWCAMEAQKLAMAGRIEKSMRWLGFIQGVLWATGFRTLEELKRDSMPPDAVYGEGQP